MKLPFFADRFLSTEAERTLFIISNFVTITVSEFELDRNFNSVQKNGVLLYVFQLHI